MIFLVNILLVVASVEAELVGTALVVESSAIALVAVVVVAYIVL